MSGLAVRILRGIPRHQLAQVAPCHVASFRYGLDPDRRDWTMAGSQAGSGTPIAVLIPSMILRLGSAQRCWPKNPPKHLVALRQNRIALIVDHSGSESGVFRSPLCDY